MNTIIKYSNKIMLALGAVMCFAGAGMCTPYIEAILKIAGFAFVVWAIVEPTVEAVEEETEQ